MEGRKLNVKLKQVSKIKVGLNSREVTKRNNNKYTAENLEEDLLTGYKIEGKKETTDDAITQAGDLIFSLMTKKAAIVSLKNSHMTLSQIYLKLTIDYKMIDPWFLCFILNESQNIDHQFHKIMEGTVSKRITKNNLEDIDIDFPDINIQKKIGAIYRLYLKQTKLTEKKNKLVKKFLFTSLEKIS